MRHRAEGHILSQLLSCPTEGTEVEITRVLRYLQEYPSVAVIFVGGSAHGLASVWTEGDRAGDVVPRRSCSGGGIALEGSFARHWSRKEPSVALSSDEPELDAVVKGISEGAGVFELYNEMCGSSSSLGRCVVVSACKGVLPRTCSGR